MDQPVTNETFNTQNPLIRLYIFYACILALKMMFLSYLTAARRFKNLAFPNPEDAARRNLQVKVCEDVERVRRAHLNDVENIPIFFVVSLAYILTDPPCSEATFMFRLYTFTRFVHTFVYAVIVFPPPTRSLSWLVGFMITMYMAGVALFNFVV